MEEEFDDRYYGYKIIQYDEVTDEDRKLQEFYDFIEASAEFLSLSGSDVGKLIDADELEKLVTSRGLDEINDSINKAKTNIKIKESGRDEEVNDKDEI